MSSLRRFLLLALPLASLVLSQPEPQESKSIAQKSSDKEDFRELLNALPEESLHAVLDNHMRPKYKDGVFEFDKAALEKVHDDDPLLASKLVHFAAILELRKRQAPSNGTSSGSSSQSSSSPPPTSVTTTTTTVTSDTTTAVTASSTASPQSSPSGNTASSTPSSTPPVSSSAASTMETSRSRSLVVITTTLTDGHVKTITSYTYVGPTPAETDNGGPTSTQGTPNLQSGAANVLSRRWGVEAAALLGGAVGVAWML